MAALSEFCGFWNRTSDIRFLNISKERLFARIGKRKNSLKHSLKFKAYNQKNSHSSPNIFSSSSFKIDRLKKKTDSETYTPETLSNSEEEARQFSNQFATKLSEENLKQLSLLFTKLEYAINSESYSQSESVLQDLIEFYSKEKVNINTEKFTLLLFTFGKLFRESNPLPTSQILHQFFTLGFNTVRAQKNFAFLKSMNIACRRMLFPNEKEGEEEAIMKFKSFVLSLRNSKLDPFQTMANKFDNRYLKGYCKHLMNTNRIQECVELMEFLHEQRLPVHEIYKSTETFSLILRNNENKQLAKRYIRLLPQHVPFFESMVKEYAKKNRLSDAFELISCMAMAWNDDVDGLKPDMHIYRLFIDLCQKEKNSDMLFQFFERMLEDGVQPNVYIYNSLMNVNSPKTELLWDIYSHMIESNVSPDEVTFNILLKSCALSANTQAGIQLYKKLLELRDKRQVRVDVITYTSAIQIFSRAKMWEEAFNVKMEMEKDGIFPNVITYTALIGACTKAGMVDKGFDIFEEMSQRGVDPNTNTYNILIDACANAGQVKRAFDLLEEMKRGGRRGGEVKESMELIQFEEKGKGELLEGRQVVKGERVGEEKRIEESMDISENKGKSEIDTVHSEALNSFKNDTEKKEKGKEKEKKKEEEEIERDFKMGFIDLDEGFKIQNENEMTAYPSPSPSSASSYTLSSFSSSSSTTTSTTTSTVYPSQNDGASRNGGHENPHHSFKKSKCFPDRVTYHSLMKACTSNAQRVREVMEEMKRMNIQSNLVTWTILIDSYASMQDMDAALKVLQEMKREDVFPDVVLYTSVIKACVKSNNIGEAFHFFDEMKSMGIKPNLITYNTLLRKNKNFGSLFWIQRAISLYHEMREAGYAPNDYLLKSLLEEWAEGAIENNEQMLGKRQIQKRQNTFRGMTDNNNDNIHSLESSNNAEKYEKYEKNEKQLENNENNENKSEKYEKNINFDVSKNLISRVSFHALENSNSDLFTVDVQNLSQTEARTTVLSVLRILKEKFQQSTVDSDLVIILDDEKKKESKAISSSSSSPPSSPSSPSPSSSSPLSPSSSIRESLMRMLKDELGFVVQTLNFDVQPLLNSHSKTKKMKSNSINSVNTHHYEEKKETEEKKKMEAEQSIHGNQRINGDCNGDDLLNENEVGNKWEGEEREKDERIKIKLKDIKVENAGKSNSNPKSRRLFSNGYVALRPSFPGKLFIPKDSLNKWLNKRRVRA